MIRGLVYSILALIVFLVSSVFWMTSRQLSEDEMTMASGWILLLSVFLIGPLFFAIGFIHNKKLKPKEPHWDSEMGE